MTLYVPSIITYRPPCKTAQSTYRCFRTDPKVSFPGFVEERQGLLLRVQLQLHAVRARHSSAFPVRIVSVSVSFLIGHLQEDPMLGKCVDWD